MNEKEVAEIRRRLSPGKNNISAIRGCYVNEKKEIVSQFSQSLPFMPEEDAEKFLGIFKKTLSGGLDRNLVDIEFTTQQVTSGQHHALLMRLRESSLEDEEAVQEFFTQVAQAASLDESFVILLAQDVYDVPFRSSDEDGFSDSSTDVFRYFICCICPVKLSKPALSYYVYENEFHSRVVDWIVSAPEFGFMFPSFDQRSTNIYNALYYSKDISGAHHNFAHTIFDCELPMAAAVQKETFQSILSNSLAQEGSFGVIQAVHSHLQDRIMEHKANKEEEPLIITKEAVKGILQAKGASAQSLGSFEEQYDNEFGADTCLRPKNIVDAKKMEVTTPGITIQVSSERSSLVETRMIDGRRYILIRAEEGVELNGVPVYIPEE